MSKIIQAFLAGALFTFILDFFLFLGIKFNYIDLHGIDLYYNILFADHQNIFLYLFLSGVFGYLIIYVHNKMRIILSTTAMLLALSTLIAPIGTFVGESLLMSKNATLHDNKYTYHGDLYYNGRKTVTFYDYDLKKVIILQKERLKENEL
jgi:hypothetical protein